MNIICAVYKNNDERCFEATVLRTFFKSLWFLWKYAIKIIHTILPLWYLPKWVDAQFWTENFSKNLRKLFCLKKQRDAHFQISFWVIFSKRVDLFQQSWNYLTNTQLQYITCPSGEIWILSVRYIGESPLYQCTSGFGSASTAQSIVTVLPRITS